MRATATIATGSSRALSPLSSSLLMFSMLMSWRIVDVDIFVFVPVHAVGIIVAPAAAFIAN
jgi:C4-dicarboxylate transporter